MKFDRKLQWLKRVCIIPAVMLMVLVILSIPQQVSAAAQQEAQVSEEVAAENAAGAKAIAAGIAIGLAAAAGAIGMAIAIAKSAEGISRQPEAAGEIRSSLTLGLVFLETAIIYAMIIAILIIFVL